MIAEGRIALDGTTLDTPATLITSLHGVTVDGKPVKEPAPARLVRFHKPAGLLTAAHDPKGRKTIYDRLPKDLPRLMPVGRLDLNTEGLLLLTSDGELKRALELPATGIERSYRARAYGDVTQAQLEELIEGVVIDGVRYGAIDANLERRTGANVWIELTLTEGKNREVRRVLEYLGLQVSRLIHTRYGPFHLADLPGGAVDEVRRHDLVLFRKTLEARGGKVASGLSFAVRAYEPPVPPEAKAEAPADPKSKRSLRKPGQRAPKPRGESANEPQGKRRRSAAPKPANPADKPAGTPSPRPRSDGDRPARPSDARRPRRGPSRPRKDR